MPNLAALINTVILKLRENASSPKFWVRSEIIEYLNRGVREFKRETECQDEREQLRPATPGKFFLPQDCLKILQVYFNDRTLAPVNPSFMDRAYIGVRGFPGVIGEDASFQQAWNTAQGDPTYWMMEGGYIRTYPILAASVVNPITRVKQRGTIAAGSTKIGLTTAITTDQNYVDLFLNGVYQNTNAWSITDTDLVSTAPAPSTSGPFTNTITLNAAMGVDLTWEVVTYPDPSIAEGKQAGSIFVGDTTISLGTAISLDKTRSSLFFNGVYQDRSTWDVTDANTITLTVACSINANWELISYPDSPNYSSKSSGTLAAGSKTITFVTTDAIDTARVDLFLQGVYQHSSQFTTSFPTPTPIPTPTPSTITNTIILDAAVPVGMEYEVVAFPSSAVATFAFKYLVQLAAGQTAIVLPRTFAMGTNAIALRINGVSQSSSAWTETSSRTLALTSALAFATEVEVTIFSSDPTTGVNARFLRSPWPMAADADVPDLPFGLEQFHEAACWWALFECFQREYQTQDLPKAQMYLAMFRAKVKEFKNNFGQVQIMMPQDNWRI